MGKVAGASKAKAKAAPAASPDLADGKAAGVNAANFQKVHQAIVVITGHPLFADIASLDALGISEGGSQTPFNKNDYKKVIEHRPYKCGGSIFMQNLLWVAGHRTPTRKSSIDYLQSYFFPHDNPPDVFPFDQVIGCEGEEDKIWEQWGAMQRVSPEEPCHAAIFSCQLAIEKKCSDDILRRWKVLLLNVPTTFEKLAPGDARFWRSVNLREEVAQKFATLVRTLRERIYEVAGFKADQEKVIGKPLSSEAVEKLYKKNIKYSKLTEVVSKSFVDTAITVSTRVLALPSCVALLEWMDTNIDITKQPFTSIYAFQALVDRAKTKELIEYSLEGLIDGFRAGHLSKDDFATNRLRDQRESMVEVLMFTKVVKEHLLGQWIYELGIPKDHAQKACEVFKDFTSVRSKYNPFPGEEVDLTWMASYPQSSILTFEFLDEVVYGKEFRGRIRDAIKSHATPDDFLAYPSISGRIIAISEALRLEQPSGAAASSATTLPIVQASNINTDGNTNPQPTLPGKSEVHAKFEQLGEDERTNWTKHIQKTIRTTCRFISSDTKTTQDQLQSQRDIIQ